jgi:hypothetical protein
VAQRCAQRPAAGGEGWIRGRSRPPRVERRLLQAGRAALGGTFLETLAMRVHLVCVAAPLVLIGALAGCASKNATNAPSSGGSGGSNPGPGGGGSGGSGAGTTSTTATTSSTNSTTTSSSTAGTGWTVVPLIDDTTNPSHMVFRSDSDLVTGIYFRTIDDGWVVTTGSQQSFQDGGAIFKAKQKQITKVLFSGQDGGGCVLGTLNFYGVDPTPNGGVVAFSEACNHIASHDNGQTFTLEALQSNDAHGIESTLALRELTNGSVLVGETGYVDTTPGLPGPNALWTTTWAPEANPPTPNPVPTAQCQGRPQGWLPATRSPVYVSPDGKFMAYTASPDHDAQVCVSTDGGKSFFPHVLPLTNSDVADFQPLGVMFANATTGIVHWGQSAYPGEAYIYRTTDSGQTWNKVALPSDIAGKGIELTNAFFAPDGMHGWIVGYDYDASVPLLISTSDAGATWKHNSGDLVAKVATTIGTGKLYAGFALDANHIWVGGDYGLLLASDTAGE